MKHYTLLILIDVMLFILTLMCVNAEAVMMILPFLASRRVLSSCPLKCEFNLRSYLIKLNSRFMSFSSVCCEFGGCANRKQNTSAQSRGGEVSDDNIRTAET